MDKIFVDEAVNELQTIQDMLRWSVSRFSAANIWYGHGTDNPWDEAVQLVLPSLYLPLDIPEDMRTARLTSSEKHRIVERVIRRVNERIPVAYLTNKAWFCGHEFYVDERVLVPRSPIGELINNKFAGLISKQPQHILDMCTGSGCIAIACAYAFPDAEVDAVDISPDALAVAEQNIEEHGLIHNVIPIRSDLFRDLPKVQYDLIVTNPPYVDAEDMSDLPNEYRHEPELGLASGTDGRPCIGIFHPRASYVQMARSYSAEFDADMRRRSESVVCLNLTAANRKRSVRRSFRSQCWPAPGNVDNTPARRSARRTPRLPV